MLCGVLYILLIFMQGDNTISPVCSEVNNAILLVVVSQGVLTVAMWLCGQLSCFLKA